MNIPASISLSLAIIGCILVLSSGRMKLKDTLPMELANGQTYQTYNTKSWEGIEARKFYGVTCFLCAGIAGIAALGLTTVRQGGL